MFTVRPASADLNNQSIINLPSNVDTNWHSVALDGIIVGSAQTTSITNKYSTKVRINLWDVLYALTGYHDTEGKLYIQYVINGKPVSKEIKHRIYTSKLSASTTEIGIVFKPKQQSHWPVIAIVISTILGSIVGALIEISI